MSDEEEMRRVRVREGERRRRTLQWRPCVECVEPLARSCPTFGPRPAMCEGPKKRKSASLFIFVTASKLPSIFPLADGWSRQTSKIKSVSQKQSMLNASPFGRGVRTQDHLEIRTSTVSFGKCLLPHPFFFSFSRKITLVNGCTRTPS